MITVFNPSTVHGTLTVTLLKLLKSCACSTISSQVSATTSAEIDLSFGKRYDISLITSTGFLPLLLTNVGFVVTPSIKPVSYPFAISDKSAVSKKFSSYLLN